MKTVIKNTICLMLLSVFLISSTSVALESGENMEDIDPLVDLAITVKIKEIRALDKISIIGKPDFFVKLLINGIEHTSPIWNDQNYVKSNWSVTQDVPDDKEIVNVKIQLFSKNLGGNKLCDLSLNNQGGTSNYDAEITYNLKTGQWSGDDFIGLQDVSGYGRLNGCDDGIINQNDGDCELWFDISQNDYDGDGIPYWTETNVFGTDPTVDNRGLDSDSDGVPIEWEFKWNYNPFSWDNHANIDVDEDGLNNVEEYLTSQWNSDPFRRDIFLEIDQMEKGPNGEGTTIPELSKNLLIDAFSKQNIAFHIDDGNMGGGGTLPFDASTTDYELQNLYFNYFLNGNSNNWRRGVFHYCLIIYHSDRYPGFVFETTADGERYSLDSLQISTKYHEYLISSMNDLYNILRYKSNDKEYRRAVFYASAIMHETGHILGMFGGFENPGCDNRDTVFPGKDWWKYHNYKSCMNYDDVYYLVDYSDGSHGENDYNDWINLDLKAFQRSHH